MDTNQEIVLIAAMTRGDQIIGVNGEIPWDVPEDVEHFHNETFGHAVIVGRETFENIGKLTGRNNVVLSKTMDGTNDVHVNASRNKKEALENAAKTIGDTYIIGGESVYRQFIDDADRMVLSLVNEDVQVEESDDVSVFPDFDASEWNIEYQHKNNDFTIIEYWR